MARAIWLNPDHKLDDLICDYLAPTDTAIDAGANVGTMTIPFSMKVGSDGLIISIEPNPRTFACLKDNVELNKCQNVTLLNAAIGEKEGSIFISNHASDDQNSVSTTSGIEVQMKTLDNIVEESKLNHITLLKIDTEGYEKYVLQGASKTLSITDCIFFETNERRLNNYGTSVQDIIAIIKSAGFIVYRIAGNAKDALAIREGSAIAKRLGQLNLEPIGS
jgi:FkbM family methyltransferase